MKVGFHSPLPPAATGVADYSAALLGELRQRAEVVCNTDEACDIDLYHLGNNPLHGAIYERALRKPGVVVLHDALLHHFFLGRLDEPAYVEEFVFNYGEWYRGLAHELWRGRSRSGMDGAYFEWPMIARVCRESLAVIVHNPGAGATVLRHAPRATVVEIPHLWTPAEVPDRTDVVSLRAALRVSENELMAGVFGHLRETKRLGAVLRAHARLRARGEPVRLLIAGEFVSPELERNYAAELAQPGVVRTGYLPEREFWLHAAAVDLCLNLRYPSAGESSGIAVRLMGAGCATMLTAGEETARFPPEACLLCDPGLCEEEQMLSYWLWALRDREGPRRMGSAAAAYIRREHDAARVASLYLDALRAAHRAGRC
ncbi:MAG: hypothetical protein J0L64_15095 [Acidobacteria bacterium]|nr:hypothetical protein [Acidobacteriota bacterium]